MKDSATMTPAGPAHVSGYAEVSGLRMYYEVHGAGPRLLLLHGAMCSIEVFKEQIPFFAREFQVIAPERMGHGRTADVAGRDFHYHDMAEETLAFMDQLNIDSAFAVGWSDGGVVGLDLAVHHPDRLRKLAVSGTNFRVSGHEAEAMEAEAIEWLLTTSPDELAPGLQRAYERLSPDGPMHWPVLVERLRKMWAAEAGYTVEQLAGIKIPTLVMIGDRDLVRPEHAVEAFRAIPGAQLCVFPHAGHAVPQVNPRLWNEAVLTFLNEPEAIEHR